MSVFVRPDGRRFVRPRDLPDAPDGELYCSLDERDEDALALADRLGFVVSRRESRYLLRTDVAPASLPGGLLIVTADQADEARLRLLDDALRQDVPGTDGWRWSAEAFRGEFDEAYDPATYLVAVDEASGAYVALVRVWLTASGPRLGMVGVLRPYRRRGIARALVSCVFAVLRERGIAEASTEIDDENEPSKALLLPLGARRVGGKIELVRPRRASP